MQYRNHSFAEIKKACFRLDKAEFGNLEKAHAFLQKEGTNRETRAHQLNTAFILGSLGFDSDTVSAAMVHEMLFEHPEKKEEMDAALGPEITHIVEDIARLKSVKNKNYGTVKNEWLAKVIMGIAKDIRSLFVELASQLDKIRKISKRKAEKQTALAELAEEVYAPIAHKIGLYELEWEMHDLALKYFRPKEYEKIKTLVGKTRHRRERFAEKVRKDIEELLRAQRIDAEVTARAKSFNGIYKKLKEQNKKFSEITDLTGIRIICGSVEECYRALGLLHFRFRPLGEFDDYIAQPKENNYQSIHTTLDWHGKTIEAQIRTPEMHRNAEEGIAAHWRYKRVGRDKDFDQRLAWIKQVVEWQRKMKKANATMRSLKLGFGGHEIFVLTPKKEIIQLSEGATALDFAFAIHSDIGRKCKGITVNGKIAPLGKVMEGGDVVEVSVSSKRQCKPGWLQIVKTEKAKSRIRKDLGIKPSAKKGRHKEKGETTTSLKRIAIAKCCSPLPGDEITGYRTTKRKVTIHSKNCPFLSLLPDGKKIGIHWGEERAKSYSAKIKVRAIEKAGILIEMLKEFEKHGARISSTDTKGEKNNTIRCTFDIELKNLKQLEKIRRGLLAIPAVLEVGR